MIYVYDTVVYGDRDQFYQKSVFYLHIFNTHYLQVLLKFGFEPGRQFIKYLLVHH